MKNTNIYKFMAMLTTAVLLFTSCTEEMSEVRLEPQLSTAQVLSVASDNAVVEGFVIAEGDGFTEKGVCYSTIADPSIDDQKAIYTEESTKATFNVTLTGLDYATKYFAKAYATGNTGTLYGEEYSFTTLPVIPTITTVEATTITGNSAQSGGNITITGGADITARGICYAINSNPTIEDNKTSDGEGLGEFESAMSSLLGNTMYYVRSYATNSAGTAYGQEVSFTTLVDLPTVSTDAVTAITKTTAISGGNATADGGDDITDKGIVWCLNENPTIDDHILSAGSDTGAFVIDITDLELYTTYHVRAYATNSAGTAYGEDIQFITLANILTWYLPGDYLAASYPGSTFANWAPENSPQVISTLETPANLEGYIYMANTNNEWKFASQPNWDDPNYGDDGTGKLDAGAGNMKSPSGYYKINVDATAMTYTAIATTWGVIGAATPNGWDDETALVYDPSSATWEGVIHLTAAEMKFRGNHDWAFNYGSDLADGNLTADGANFAVASEGDYDIVLDLSHPNTYTYSLTTWGLIGSATPDGWDADQNMTYDATNEVWVVTLDLIEGEIKLRANDDWAMDYGGADGTLEAGGANIAVAEAGNYTVTFDLNNKTYTVVKN